MKHSILLNLENQDKDTQKNKEDVKSTYKFYKKPSDEDTFEKLIIEDIIKNEPYEHKKKRNTLYLTNCPRCSNN